MPKQITMWLALDGTHHKTEGDALAHETRNTLRERLDAFLDRYDLEEIADALIDHGWVERVPEEICYEK